MSDNGYYDEEEGTEEDYEDVEVIPGAGQELVDDESADLASRVERLAAWEEQLLAYNGKLAEEGWKSWKKGAVTSVMHELQRKVVPDVWRDEVGAANEVVRSMAAQLAEVRERERVLTAKIDLLENGPGCASELRERLEAAEVQRVHICICTPRPPEKCIYIPWRPEMQYTYFTGAHIYTCWSWRHTCIYIHVHIYTHIRHRCSSSRRRRHTCIYLHMHIHICTRHRCGSSRRRRHTCICLHMHMHICIRHRCC